MDKIPQDVVENVVGNVVEERLTKILSFIKRNSELTPNEIAKLLETTERTIQRDFQKVKKAQQNQTNRER
jgi:DeoR/GlpR family transcriptional regulator of sugar metabolism